MFNLNIPTTSLLGIDGSSLCTTPKTPEILNSLMAMTNPLDNYTFTPATTAQQQLQQQTNATTISQNGNHQMISQDSNHSSCSGSPLDSPAGSNSTPSVQQTRSQLIKAGLKLTIQSKRKMSSSDSSSGTDQPNSKTSRKTCESSGEEEMDSRGSIKQNAGLTPEDEDRRRRRRERNKIAATKCRMKKRERTNNLVNESEQLETQNNDLKSTVRNLELERRKLFDMLQSHSSACIRPGGLQLDLNACQSPAYKYLNEIGLGDGPCETHQHPDQQQSQQQQRTITAIPPMTTIKYSRNNLRHQPQHQQTLSNLPSNDLQQQQLPNGYCKPSPTTHEMGYLNSPTQDICMHLHDITSQPTSTTHHTQHHHMHHHQITDAILNNDYIPNCENSNGGSTVDSTPDHVFKSELNEAQSPYTTVQSADRFLFESNCDTFDIKHSIATTPTYDNLLNKTDFLTNDTELLAQLTDATDSEFTDLDSGIAYSHITNGGCLA
ncbi:unnamed protein product [Hermetia illucens]|uniref:BZIP domain-containing protein n=1 Tax=Hermetia illucens TaxID=343691 RepID=A0A7R8UTH7_HERIL|nr:unnamed protein product [Hermetia illucens]